MNGTNITSCASRKRGAPRPLRVTMKNICLKYPTIRNFLRSAAGSCFSEKSRRCRNHHVARQSSRLLSEAGVGSIVCPMWFHGRRTSGGPYFQLVSSLDVAIGPKIDENGQRRVSTADGNPDFDLSTGITGTGKRKRTIMGKLDEKVAIVTGAARGLGR